MSPRIVVALLVAALTVAFAGLAYGQGQTVEIASQIKLKARGANFHGKVTADNPNCAEQRTVKLFVKYGDGSRSLLGKTTSDAKGKYKIKYSDIASGAYYTVAKKSEQGTAGTIYVCLKAKSNVLVAD
jgi:hypothetical protein